MSIEPRRLIAAVAVGVALLAGATFVVDRTISKTPPSEPSAPAPPGAASLTIASFVFEPTPLVVPPGATVSITNRDDANHTVTSGARDQPDGAFDVKVDASGTGSFVAPSAPGDYPYVCNIHPGMKATIEVAP